MTSQLTAAFIENVYIYDQDRIGIVFQHEDEIAKLLESLKEVDDADDNGCREAFLSEYNLA